jgi:tetratricopeptide (TPR) repeat protein
MNVRYLRLSWQAHLKNRKTLSKNGANHCKNGFLSLIVLLLFFIAYSVQIPPALGKTLPSDDASADERSKNKSAAGSQGTNHNAASTKSSKKAYADEAIKHYNRGVELHQSGFLNQAIAEYRLAIEADERMEEAYSNLGVIYAAQHNYPKAKDAFLKAISLRPNRPTTLNGLGTVLYAQGHIDEAKEQWKSAISVDPNFSSAYYNIGNALESERKLDEAKDAYVKAVAVMPTMADAYFRIGIIYNKEHHSAQASAMLNKAVALAPGAEFVRDAKRLITNLDNSFAKESDVHTSKAQGKTIAKERTLSAETPQHQAKTSPKKKVGEDSMNIFVHQPAEGGDNSVESTGKNPTSP